ncbi:hypothetical protein HYH03_008465 [Edaphochlamys debaryana]|uniref:Uncharacterized protein n=1 Tax=Edaphochlamys debaryana TaxID=47281 RepID=A0A836BY90_9CHLO|nr:hypothetical protein HYH03_008465 [Edaphochlamys debaryana]|eukprot:KAG2493330.1 hypothetical protein HYH03_008465 [Edaphochlamys debaryana]
MTLQPRRIPATALALLGLLLAAGLLYGMGPAHAHATPRTLFTAGRALLQQGGGQGEGGDVCAPLRSALAFRECARGKGDSIDADCCGKYYTCINDATLVAAANQFLAGATTVDSAHRGCLRQQGR